MRNRLIGSIVVVVAVMAFSPGILAQTPTGPGAGKAIPDLTGLWEVRINPPGTPPTICGEPACRAAAGLALPQVFTRDAEEKLSRRLGTRVQIVRKRRGGKIEISFGSEEELIGLFERLRGK